MSHATARKPNTKKSKPIGGICAAAAALGCSRQHLWSVLTGQRQSRSLTARYQALARAGLPLKEAA